MYETSSTCRVCRKIDSVLSDSFLTKTRSGIGSLQVRIEGFGSLASADIRGGPAVRSVMDPEIFWNRLFVFEAPPPPRLLNSCCRRAYVSWLGFPVLGGSMGRKFKGVIWKMVRTYT